MSQIFESIFHGIIQTIAESVAVGVVEVLKICKEQAGLSELEIKLWVNMTKEERNLNPKYRQMTTCFYGKLVNKKKTSKISVSSSVNN